MRYGSGGIAILVMLLACADVSARPPGSVIQNIAVTDRAFDDGSALVITWSWGDIEGFRVLILRKEAGGPRDTVGTFPAQVQRITDTGIRPGTAYSYEFELYDERGRLVSRAGSESAQPRANVFDRARTGELLIILFLFAIILWYTLRARDLYVRPIAGLAAMEEALGRAVEMGRPVLFSAGWGAQLDKPTTMAAMNIFGWLASKSAAYGARLKYPAHDAVIMAAAQEAARDSAQLEGKPEWYRADDIYYITGSQFGYAAALDGIMERERPAANLWLGTFAAESLILAETGNHVGAIQIAGTDSTIQLAFFLVTCDYTLIGEEVFAASAYLTRDPQVLGGLRAQDLLKIAVAATIVVGLVGSLFGWTTIGDWLRGI